MLIYERSAVDGGEYWRLFTSSLVHFSWAHLAGDAAVVLLAGSLLSGRRASEVWTLVGGAALAAGVAVLLLAPGLARYGGLSGIAHAVVVYGALGGVVRPGWRRVPAVLVVAIVAGKLALDASVVRPMSASYAGATVVVASASHLGAVAFAVLFFAAGAAVRDVRRSRRTPPHPSRAVP
jgi:rhomboid family GlyGly-CTERM serine protease